ncbi:hypothetical protein [Streptomyces sp. NPDC054837]
MGTAGRDLVGRRAEFGVCGTTAAPCRPGRSRVPAGTAARVAGASYGVRVSVVALRDPRQLSAARVSLTRPRRGDGGPGTECGCVADDSR